MFLYIVVEKVCVRINSFMLNFVIVRNGGYINYLDL